MYLDYLYSAFLDWGSIYLGWLGFRHPDSVVGGLWKITIFARQLARGCLSPPLLFLHPRHCRPAGLGLAAITFGKILSRVQRH